MERTAINNLPLNYVQMIALAEIAEEMFTRRLLELDPRWQEAFTDTCAASPLSQAIREAVAGFTCLSGYAEALEVLDIRQPSAAHSGLDYETLGAIFLARLERKLCAPLDSRTREKWQTVFHLLAETRRQASAA